ncbi:hypothetical protein NQ015_09815 [Corynebacterium sp. 153RC1]|uniref:hypothetical protein n=1 Tax=unclassified Corynebacterium TaxID=2624378 RepID=UPI00211CB935|nr:MULTISPECIES: hypothetical protein [unclassified Corynebacterium]MCQ9352885.1 hypothetical protein [Corynebacterium sp. 209RC1]MCQ9355091.1 hypothetical protein [Corynebacterium sp. 1222RC1]MCQ9357453.1 hypothetical protein [Corynebacterium sp. 122RC1]MCQ9359832.1 hypothetical protein [Corynebacterium sp. 142RC1]MCQ9362048.1 hypothetical protein [Corynebacterium sp. 153RC1]
MLDHTPTAPFSPKTLQGRAPWVGETLAASAIVGTTMLVQLLMMHWLGEGPLGNALASWDGEHYLAIAREGYFAGGNEATRLAFFPGFPALLALAELLGVPAIAAAHVINTLACVALAVGIMRLVRVGLTGLADGGAAAVGIAAGSAAVFVLGAPMALTFHMVYTEALFLSLSVWALLAMMQRAWGRAALMVFLAGFIRLTAIDLWAVFVLCMLVGVLGCGGLRWLRLVGLAVVSALPLVGYLSWASWHTRELGGYFGIQRAGWNSSFDFGAATLRWIVSRASSDEPGYLISSAAIIGALVIVVMGVGGFGFGAGAGVGLRGGGLQGAVRAFFEWRWWPVWLFAAAVAANVLLSDGIMHSRPRLLLPVFLAAIPAVVWLAGHIARWRLVLLGGLWVVFGAWISAYMVGPFTWAI